MIVKVNCDGKHGNITFEQGQELEVESKVGHEMICSGIAETVEHDSPRKRAPKCKQVLEAPKKKD